MDQKVAYHSEQGSHDKCAICGVWGDKPDLECNQCPNSYHIKCLPSKYRDHSKWWNCTEIERDCDLHPDGLFTFHKTEEPYNVSSPIKGVKREHFRSISYGAKVYCIGDNVRIDRKEGFDVARITDFYKDSDTKKFHFDGIYFVPKCEVEKEGNECRLEEEEIDPPVHPQRMLYFDQSYYFDGRKEGFPVDTIQCKVTLVNPREKNVFYCDPQYEYDGKRKRIVRVKLETKVSGDKKAAMRQSLNELKDALSRFKELRLEMERINGQVVESEDKSMKEGDKRRSRKRTFSEMNE